MTEKRTERFKGVVNRRQADLTVVLENVHDQHNIGAVMRTCDSVGIYEIFILQTDPELQFSNIHVGKKTAAGTRKWVDIHFFTNREACFKKIREKCDHVFATHLDAEAKSLHSLDLTQSTALLFGNEKDGVTKETLELCDGNFIIPQMGLVKSLNISVACAVSLYEALRQRDAKGFYDKNPTMNDAQRTALFDLYKARHDGEETFKSIGRSDFDL